MMIGGEAMDDRPDFDVYEAIEEDIAQAVELLRPQLPHLRKEYQQRFDAHIAQLHLDWRDPFDRYGECLVLATSLGMKYGEVYIPHVEIRGDWTFAALHRLHGRACLIGSEIRVLLQSGHGIAAEA